ncbi:hypothetical protein DVH24_029610 [Malus domestica]|uniref:Uncharacterized protein n=1 Tax=Malus domestica TaxID=3750 RepID=A0A498HW49_MALDO|nr:hypothetical protein DVH24_029610 [Malus domestica]
MPRIQRLLMRSRSNLEDAAATEEDRDRDRTWRCSCYGRRLRSNLEMQLIRERMRGKATGKGSG